MEEWIDGKEKKDLQKKYFWKSTLTSTINLFQGQTYRYGLIWDFHIIIVAKLYNPLREKQAKIYTNQVKYESKVIYICIYLYLIFKLEYELQETSTFVTSTTHLISKINS